MTRNAIDSRPDEASFAFGHDVCGPIFAQFAMRLWLFLASMDEPDRTCVLFCSRGGLRLKAIYERYLAAAGLTSPVAADHVMISRLVAARPALLNGSEAAIEEIGREFASSTFEDVIRALTQSDAPLADEWRGPFSRDALRRFLVSDHPDADRVRGELRRQNELFERHLAIRSRGLGRIVLCDTGLNGSTLRLLQDGMPRLEWSCALFARRNYKGFSVGHFDRVVGLSVEQDAYDPLNSNTSVLRYWHLVEWLLEPKLKSVKSFSEAPGRAEPVSNLEVPGWENEVAPDDRGLFSGLLAYVDGLDPASAFDRIDAEAAVAWRRLRRAITWPQLTDVRVIGIEDRSSDFGRDERTQAFRAQAGAPLRAKIEALRGCFWREGEMAIAFGPARHVLLGGLEAAYWARWTKRVLKGGLARATGR